MSQEKYCPNCEDYHETRIENRQETYTVRGRKITVPAEVEICAGCGAVISSEQRDQEILDAVNAAYRRQEDLLTPAQIVKIRRRYALSQKSFAVLLGMSEATVNRYEKGNLQDQVHDNAIRACENSDIVRDLLERKGNLLTDWQRDRVEKALTGDSVSDNQTEIALGDWGMTSMSNEVTARTGFRRFDFKRYAATVVYFCKKLNSIPQTKLYKLLFYADFLACKVSSISLTGAPYRRLQYGPVPANYEYWLNCLERDEFISKEQEEYSNGYAGLVIIPGPKADQADFLFTETEQNVLDRVASKFRDTTATSISRQSHEESAWRNTEAKQLISYSQAANLSLSLEE